MDSLALAQQTLTAFLQAVKARKKRAAVACATRELQTRGGDDAGRLFDVVGGRRAAPGRSAVVDESVLAEIWLNVTYNFPSRRLVHRDTLVVRLDLEDGAWRIAEAELDDILLPGKERLRGQPDPGAPELPDAITQWLADHAAGRVPGPLEGPLNAARDELRACMVKRARKTWRVQARLSGLGHQRRRWLWLTFKQRGEVWEMTGWEDC